MAFAQPMALLFFLFFIPILLLYLLKQRRRRVLVSTLMFWDAILRDEHRVTSLTRLRKLLSLLLQLLFVTLLALALAKPVFSKDLLGARRMVVLLDTSASMTALEASGTRFELARKEVEKVVRSMTSGDSLMLVTTAERPDIAIPFSDSRRAILDALKRIDVTHGSTDFRGAFDLLRNLPPDSRETWVYVVSDGAFDPVEMDIPANLKLAYIRLGETKENIGITAFQLRPLPTSPRDFEVLFEVSNETPKEQRIPFEVRVGGGLVDAGELILAPASRQSRSLRQFTQAGGEVEVMLDYQDAFPLDNVAYAVLPRPEPVPVLLVTEGNLFLESALLTDDAIALETQAPSAFANPSSSEDGKPKPEVLVFDRWSPEATPRGNVIFIGFWPADLGVEKTGDLEKPLVTDWDRNHPVNRYLQFANVSIERAFSTEAPDDFQRLIKAFDDALVLYRDTPQDKTLVIAFDTTTSDLPLRVAFPILIANTIRHMVSISNDERWPSLSVGTILSPSEVEGYKSRCLSGENRSQSVAILRPGEPVNVPEGGVTKAQEHLPTLLPVDRVGVYAMVTSEGERVPLFAANLNNRRESRIAPSETLPLTSSKPIPMVKESFRLGGEPWLYLVVLAMLLCTVEWALYHRRLVE